MADSEEDDYLTMTFEEPKKKEKETYSQRRQRKEREAEAKRPRSKAELEAQAAATRDAELSKKLDASNKGFKMLQMMGFKEGMKLGKQDGGSAEPIPIEFKAGRGGIGLDSQKKRELADAFESEAKRAKESQADYRERVRSERENDRLEAQVFGAQKVAEEMDSPEKPDIDVAGKVQQRPTSQINVLWRGLARRRQNQERERRARHDLIQSLSRHYDDEEGEHGLYEEEVETEDPELDEFEALPPNERLDKLVRFLRDTYHYCFWCKYRYLDAEMEGCPGLTEEDHD